MTNLSKNRPAIKSSSAGRTGPVAITAAPTFRGQRTSAASSSISRKINRSKRTRIVAVSTNGEQQDLRIGDSIFVEFEKNTPTWVPAIILKVKGTQLHAKLDPAIASTCGIDRQSVSVTIDKILVAAQR